jgi:hypothetical protein
MPPGNEAHAKTISYQWVHKPPTLYRIDGEVRESPRPTAPAFSAPAPADEQGATPERYADGKGATVGLPRDTRLFALLAAVSAASAFLALQAMGVDVLPSAPAVVGEGGQDLVVAADSSDLRERALVADVKSRWAGGAMETSAAPAAGTRVQGAREGKPQDTQEKPVPPPPGGGGDSGSNNLTLPVIGETPAPEPELPAPAPDPGLPEVPLPEPALPEL